MTALTLAEPTRQPLFIEVEPDFYAFEGQSFEEHVDCWQEVDSQVQKDKWKLSSVAASLTTKYNEQTIKRFAYETHRSSRRVWEYSQTYKAFEKCGRSHRLSFSHHTVAASADDPVLAIQKAEDGEWSVRDLKRWIATGLEPGESPPPLEVDETEVLQTPEAQEWLAAIHAAILPHIDTVPAGAEFLGVMARSLDGVVLYQSERTVEADCLKVMDCIEENGGMSGDDIYDWLVEHFYFMSEEQLHDRLVAMVANKEIIATDAGKDGKQANRRGKLPKWYEPYYTKREKRKLCKKCGEWHADPEDCLEV